MVIFLSDNDKEAVRRIFTTQERHHPAHKVVTGPHIFIIISTSVSNTDTTFLYLTNSRDQTKLQNSSEN